MKKILIAVCILVSSTQAMAQGRIYATLDDVYRDFMVQSHSQFNKAVLNDFMGVGGDKRFMSNNWLVGGATNNFNVTISGNYFFNYDFLGQELHAKWKDTTIIVNTNYVKRFFLQDATGIHYFVKSQTIDPPGKFFFESIGFDESRSDSLPTVQLLKLRTVKKVKANKDEYLANFSGDYSDKLDNDITYYIQLPDNTFTKVKMNSKSIQAALTGYSKKVSDYLSKNSVRDENAAAGLIQYLNQ